MPLTIAEPPAVRASFVDDEHRRAVWLRVLNASSGTRASERSTAVAAAIAAERVGELFVVHVAEPIKVRVTRLGPTLVRPRRLDDPFADPVLIRARRVASANGALARLVLMAGDPVEAILVAARDLRVDLIAIGARSVRMPPFMAAPTRHRLQRVAPVPVLAVPLQGPVGEVTRDTDARGGGAGRC
jgi:nucleotide-binding universal stress UspA family protein